MWVIWAVRGLSVIGGWELFQGVRGLFGGGDGGGAGTPGGATLRVSPFAMIGLGAAVMWFAMKRR